MEVSSHSLDQDRVRGVQFAVGVFTNLTQDHLDYHGDMKSYLQAKARLFQALKPGATAVLNRDDPAAVMMAEQLETGVNIIWYGLSPEADIRAEDIQPGPDGTRLRIANEHRQISPNDRAIYDFVLSTNTVSYTHLTLPTICSV